MQTVTLLLGKLGCKYDGSRGNFKDEDHFYFSISMTKCNTALEKAVTFP